MAFNYSPKIVTDGLVFAVDAANKKSYPGSGTTWSDLSGNGNNGTLTNGPTFDSGNGGNIVFDGSDDIVQGTGISNGGGSGTSQSYNIWFKIDNPTNGNQGLFFWDQYNGIATYSVGGEIFIQTRGDNSIGDFSSTPTATANTWHNVSFNFNQGVSYECWIDGVSFGSVATSDTSNEPASSQKWSIGSRLDDSNNFLDYLDGNIAIVQAYNRALSSTEVTQNYNALKSRFGL